MLKSKDVLAGGAIIGLGYLLFTYKSGEVGGGAGGAGGAGEEFKEKVGVVADELGGLGVSTPNYTINIPGTGGASYIFPDFPPAPDVPSLTPDPVKPFDWPKTDLIEGLKKFDILNELISVPTEDLEEAIGGATTIFTSKKGQAIIPAVAAGNPISAILGGIKSFFPTASAKKTSKARGGNIKSSHGRAERVAAWKKKYGEPSYNVIHRVKA